MSLGYFPMLYLVVAYAVAIGNIGDNWLAEMEANQLANLEDSKLRDTQV